MQKPVVVPPPFIPYGWDLNRFASLIGSKTVALERARPETSYYVPKKGGFTGWLQGVYGRIDSGALSMCAAL